MRLVTEIAYANDIGEIARLFIGDAFIDVSETNQREPDTLFCVLKGNTAVASYIFQGGEYTKSVGFEPWDDGLARKKHEKRALKLAAFDVLKRAFPLVSTPWGSLTGIRPTKLMREFITQGGEAYAKDVFLNTFSVEKDKVELAARVCRAQEPYLDGGKDAFDLYAGIPFCRTRCLYCSFAAYELGKGCASIQGVEEYVDALIGEIKVNAKNALDLGYKLRSAYIGGGTPTALSCGQLERVIAAILEVCGSAGREFTVEAGRPDTITRQKLDMMKAMGVTRISVNPQTMNDATLALIGRSHSAQDIERCFYLVREVGFDSVNMDTIIALPGETPEMTEESFERIARLAPDNLTVHTLAIKRSSKLKERLGEIELPSAHSAQIMLNSAHRWAKAMNMEPYYMYRQKYMAGNLENVGFATKGKQSVYNIDIMEERVNVLALGAGAITKWLFDGGARLEREPNPKDLATYTAKLPQMNQRRLRMLKEGLQ